MLSFWSCRPSDTPEVVKGKTITLIRIEPNFEYKLLAKILQPVRSKVYPCAIEEIRHSNQKKRG